MKGFSSRSAGPMIAMAFDLAIEVIAIVAKRS